MLVRVGCIRNTTDGSYHYYRQGAEYVVEHDHPCMAHFEKLEDVGEERLREQQHFEKPDAPGSQLVSPPASKTKAARTREAQAARKADASKN